MSTEQDKSKVTSDDEKFINELYAELESELTNSPDDHLHDEQPSESLDQSILAAAHKAVGSCPKVAEDSVDKSQRIKKSPAWHVPLSLAASTVLVVSLVVNQGEESLLPNESVMPSPEAVQSDMQYERAVSTKDQAVSERKVMAQGKSRELAKQRSRQAKKMASAPAQVAKKKAVRAKAQTYTGLLSVEEGAMNDIKLAQAEHAPTVISESVASLNKQLSGSKRAEQAVMPWLSYQQYSLFKEQGSQWSLLKDSQYYYLINVFTNKDQPERYKISKDNFKVDISLSDEISKLSFEHIKYLNKE